MPAYGVTVNAVFTAISYGITYNLDGGTNHASNPAIYTIEDTPVTLQAPSKSGYDFAGWTNGGIITAGSIGAKEFTAQWAVLYNLAIGTFTGGEVTSAKASYALDEAVTLTIAPAANYVLDSISAYKTGETGTAVALTGSGNTRTFNMPAYGVTITATFRNPDSEAVAAAKALIEGATYTVVQSVANTEADVKTWLVSQISALTGWTETGVTIAVANITVSAITPASTGVNGSFTFTVSLSKGGSSATSNEKIGTITANPNGIPTANTPFVNLTVKDGEIQAVFEGTAPVKLYSVTGVLLHQETVTDIYTINVKSGIYILSIDGTAYKVIVK
jgi:uncharacterized repeat protein (TIGR02543 family)